METTLQTLTRLLARDDVRLLTLLGIGGIGKTRMSIELAQRSNVDSCFVDLSTLNDSAQFIENIARTLGVKDATLSGLKKSIKNRAFLLILDNFGHLLPSRKLISDLLAYSPLLKILVTSRIALQIYGEHEFVIQPLTVADMETVKGQQLWAQSPAVILFIQRAQSVKPNFSLNNENVEVITELCQRMEGLPLAIELAAYQMKYYSPQAILKLSNNRLDFLSQGPKMMLPHQQTMRAMLDWSFTLLSHELQNFFCQLSIFPASFTLTEVESAIKFKNIQAGLTALIDQSLLEHCPCTDGEPRFKMLGIVHEYACEHLQKLNFQPTS